MLDYFSINVWLIHFRFLQSRRSYFTYPLHLLMQQQGFVPPRRHLLQHPLYLHSILNSISGRKTQREVQRERKQVLGYPSTFRLCLILPRSMRDKVWKIKWIYTNIEFAKLKSIWFVNRYDYEIIDQCDSFLFFQNQTKLLVIMFALLNVSNARKHGV